MCVSGKRSGLQVLRHDLIAASQLHQVSRGGLSAMKIQGCLRSLRQLLARDIQRGTDFAKELCRAQFLWLQDVEQTAPGERSRANELLSPRGNPGNADDWRAAGYGLDNRVIAAHADHGIDEAKPFGQARHELVETRA